MQFEIETYAARNVAGLSGVGIKWGEARTGTEWVLFTIGKGAYYLGFWSGLFCLPAGFMYGGAAGWFLFFVAMLALSAAWGLIWMGWRVPAEERWIEFAHDGTIRGSEQGAWRTTAYDIANIESEELKKVKEEDDLPYTHGVRIITTRGRVLHVAKNLEPDNAAGLAVALTEAYEAVKYVDVVMGRGEPEPVW